MKPSRPAPLLIILLLHLALALAFSALIPLGEAPDEPAHFSYAQFIAKKGRLPATLAERREAGYRAAWPPLYHALVAAPIAAVGNAPPTRLKAVGDTARRLIPTNGQTIATFIHTQDEAWPWRGVTLAWHLGRLISVGLSTLAVAVTYFVALKLSRSRRLAVTATACHAFLPQFLFIGATLNDDTLLILLSGLILLLLVDDSQRPQPPGFGRWLGLGALLGLATVAKYNALPLWGIVLIGLTLLATRINIAPVRQLILALAALLLGAALTAGWWFGFIWVKFNQIDALGPVRGTLAALTAGTSDASLRRLGSDTALTLPPASDWSAWAVAMFKSFGGAFGGGSSIELPGWVYGLLLAVTLLALVGLLRRWPRPAMSRLILLTPLFFLPLPLLRFALSHSLIETAQGRHLFPALAALATGLAWGWAQILPRRAARTLPGLLLPLSGLGLGLIASGYPPLIPLRTTPIPTTADWTPARLTPAIELISAAAGPVEVGVLPLELVWQATATPAEDYLIKVTVFNADGRPVGGWLGQPVGGRYPTRAWDKGDFVRDSLPIPLLSAAGSATVAISLLDSAGQPAAPPAQLALTLPAAGQPAALLPAQLRSDGLPPTAPFTYRSTLSLRLPGQTAPPQLLGPTGQTFAPDNFLPGGIAQFLVGPNWPSGEYRLETTATTQNLKLTINNRPRQFEAPPLQTPVNANFAGLITLLGYDLPQRRVAPGQSFPLTLHWQANRTIGQNLTVFNHLLAANTAQHGGADRIPQNFYTTLLWVPGEIVSDAYTVPVDAAAPPGIYWLDVGLYPTDRPSQSLPLVENGQPVNRTGVAIGPIKVGGPPPGVTTPQAAPATPLNVPFGQEITLLGVDAAPGALTFYWQAAAIPQADYTVFVHLLNAGGQLAAQADAPPAGGAYPTSLWDAGEVIVDVHSLPANLPPGQYTAQVGLYRPDTGQRLPAAGSTDGGVQLPPLKLP